MKKLRIPAGQGDGALWAGEMMGLAERTDPYYNGGRPFRKGADPMKIIDAHLHLFPPSPSTDAMARAVGHENSAGHLRQAYSQLDRKSVV